MCIRLKDPSSQVNRRKPTVRVGVKGSTLHHWIRMSNKAFDFQTNKEIGIKCQRSHTGCTF